MNREIKFRAWDKENKKMKYNITGIEYGNGAGNINGIFIDGDIYEIEKIELMQYTGLHDKNGKEIYEGDIVEYRDSRGQHTEKVIFEKGCFYAGMHWGSSTRVAPKLINPRITEVIGNEFDNPELLGGKDGI